MHQCGLGMIGHSFGLGAQVAPQSGSELQLCHQGTPLDIGPWGEVNLDYCKGEEGGGMGTCETFTSYT